jgi:uncharacterized circularly permuted ATP-grasp superfamily protein
MSGFFNEMYNSDGPQVRPHYREFEHWLSKQAPDIVERKCIELKPPAMCSQRVDI